MPDNIYSADSVNSTCMHIHIYTYTCIYIPSLARAGNRPLCTLICIDIQRLTAHMFKSQVNLFHLPDHFVQCISPKIKLLFCRM